MDAARRDTSISGLRIYRLRFVLGALRSIIVPKPFRSTHAGTTRVLRTVPAASRFWRSAVGQQARRCVRWHGEHAVVR